MRVYIESLARDNILLIDYGRQVYHWKWPKISGCVVWTSCSSDQKFQACTENPSWTLSTLTAQLRLGSVSAQNFLSWALSRAGVKCPSMMNWWVGWVKSQLYPHVLNVLGLLISHVVCGTWLICICKLDVICIPRTFSTLGCSPNIKARYCITHIISCKGLLWGDYV